MDWRRRSKLVSAEEHRRQVDDAQQQVFDLQRKLRDEVMTVDTLNRLGDAYEAYIRIATEDVELAEEPVATTV